MTDSVPEDQTAATPPAAHNRQSMAKSRVNWTREQRLAAWANAASFANVAAAIAAFVLLLLTLQATQGSLVATQKAVAEAREQAVQARRQADTAQATLIQSTRAWINVSVDPTSVSLTWDKTERPTIKATLKGTNEGSSPAIDVQIFPVLFFPQNGLATVIRSRIRTLCSGTDMVGNMVFVKDGLDQIGITSLQDDLVKSWIDRVRKKIAPDQQLPVPFSLAICAAYKIVGDDLTHHTARIYDIGRVSPTGSLMPVLGENMTADYISLTKEYNGEYAD